MSSEINLDSKDQDRVLHFCFYSDDFISKCNRKGVSSDMFSSQIRKKIFDLVIGYYNKYGKAPKDDVIDLVTTELDEKKFIRKNEEDLFASKIEDILTLDCSSSSVAYLMDRMDEFIRKRVALNAARDITVLSNKPELDYNTILEVMDTAVRTVNSSTGSFMVESLIDDDDYDFSSDVVTRFNIKEFDDALGGGIRLSQFAVILGYTGRGKSWCVTHLSKISARYGITPLVISIEMNNRTLKKRLKMSMTGKTERQVYTDSTETKNIIKLSMVKNSNILILSDEEKGMRVDDLPSILKEVEERNGEKIPLIIFDSADDVLPPEGKYRSRTEQLTEIYTYLKNYAKDNNVAIVTTTQAQRIGDKIEWLSSGNVGDDINKMRRATVGISINARENELKKGYARLYIFKQTDGPTGTKIWVKQNF